MMLIAEECPRRTGAKIIDFSEHAEADYKKFRREKSTDWVRADLVGKINDRGIIIEDFRKLEAVSHDEAINQLRKTRDRF